MTGVSVFKKKANKDQHKLNAKVATKIKEAEAYLDYNKIEDDRHKIAEGSS